MKALAPGVTLRPLRAADLPAASELRRLAGWNQTERDWAGYLEFEPAGCLAAEFEGRVVGTATTITYGSRFGWIGMVLVDPSHRRGGIGSVLLDRSIQYLRTKGVAGIKLDATPMGRAVYLPMGFRDEYELARYEGVAGEFNHPSEDVEAFTASDWEEAVAFDAAVFGAERCAVIRSLAGRNPEWCFVARKKGRIAGLVIARQGSNAVQVGPWIASDEAIAAGLIAAVWRRIAGRRVFVDVPAPNSAGTALVGRLGLGVQRGFTRMYLGENAFPGQPEWWYSTSGAEKG